MPLGGAHVAGMLFAVPRSGYVALAANLAVVTATCWALLAPPTQAAAYYIPLHANLQPTPVLALPAAPQWLTTIQGGMTVQTLAATPKGSRQTTQETSVAPEGLSGVLQKVRALPFAQKVFLGIALQVIPWSLFFYLALKLPGG
uniref:Uncharacterized protein n=1 Tax=Eutreptiella gymnastica TaxID=73025 RepID=A0A7S1J898_9EUGL